MLRKVPPVLSRSFAALKQNLGFYKSIARKCEHTELGTKKIISYLHALAATVMTCTVPSVFTRRLATIQMKIWTFSDVARNSLNRTRSQNFAPKTRDWLEIHKIRETWEIETDVNGSQNTSGARLFNRFRSTTYGLVYSSEKRGRKKTIFITSEDDVHEIHEAILQSCGKQQQMASPVSPNCFKESVGREKVRPIKIFMYVLHVAKCERKKRLGPK